MNQLKMRIHPESYAVCQIPPDEDLPSGLIEQKIPFLSITRTDEETSIVLPENKTQQDWKAETGWRCLQVIGPLPFNMIGVLASLSAPLAAAGISIFVISTYDTDYLLIKEEKLKDTVHLLEQNNVIFC